jgi:hypothetical protein
MFARVSLMPEGKTNNITNNRDGDIHPCSAMFSGVEMPLWKTAKNHLCMRFSLDHHAVPPAVI